MIVENLDDFTRHYLGAALWSSTDDDGKPLDDGRDISDIAPCAIEKAIADCKRFQESAGDMLSRAYTFYDHTGMSNHPDAGSAQACAGHDFWLTRCGHGVGFWDRGMGEIGDQLSAMVGLFTDFPPVDLYIGDDGRLYLD